MKRTLGFTLIELMIVVAVIAILATIALSGYNNQIRKSRRAEAKQAISDVSLREEKWRANHVMYYGTDSDAAEITAFGALPTSNYYNIAITTAEHGQNFTITATPKSGNDQTKDKCGTLQLASAAGVVTKSPTTGDCW